MSVVIKSLDKPSDCLRCPFSNQSGVVNAGINDSRGVPLYQYEYSCFVAPFGQAPQITDHVFNQTMPTWCPVSEYSATGNLPKNRIDLVKDGLNNIARELKAVKAQLYLYEKTLKEDTDERSI